ncbi:antirestriction protein [Pantoea agglomerans]|uniref:antirestriction protein n=1 Tax=Enterobacter agglomerans TaxID=549 RepID=UPI0034CE1618
MNTQPHVFPTASVLADFVSLRFLPSLFGHDYVQAENNVYLYASRYLANYDGTVWDFVQLPGGGGYMKPEGEERYMYSNPYHWTELEISADAAGIIITALVLNHRSWLYDRHDDEELSTHFCQRHRQLMERVKTHPEAAAIFCALN